MCNLYYADLLIMPMSDVRCSRFMTITPKTPA